MGAETYRCTNEKHGRGTFFYTDCGNVMYSVNNDWEFYNGKICPKCGNILFIRGSEEANKILGEMPYDIRRSIRITEKP